jgi:YaiO family outer membrane protein
VGFSNDSIFPNYKAGFELYQGIPYAMEVSGGFRYLKFYPDIAVLLTLSLSKYLQDYLFIVRPYFNLNNKKIFSSLIFGARKYFNEPFDYLGVNFSFGNSPDDPGKQTFMVNDIYTLNSIKTWTDFRCRIISRFLVNIILSFEHEEYIKDKYRNKFSIGSGLSVLF